MRNFALGMLAAFMLTACAGFQYRYYTFDVPHFDGQLLGKLGKDGWPDLPFSMCQPIAGDKAPCILQFRPEYEALLTDLEKTKIALKACQKGQ